MKFKRIKGDMFVHCGTEEQADALLNHLEKLGYRWNTSRIIVNGRKGSGREKLSQYGNRYHVFGKETCYKIMEQDKCICITDRAGVVQMRQKLVEFSDLYSS